MTRIQPLATAHADANTRATLEAVKAKMGMLPNMIATLAHSPVALNGYLALSELTSGGQLSARQREIIALAVAQANACQYCLSAHSVIGKGAGLSASDIQHARNGNANNEVDAAIARFARQLADNRGVISDADFSALQQADIGPELALEILLNVVMNLFTNYTNHLADTAIDFPVVAL